MFDTYLMYLHGYIILLVSPYTETISILFASTPGGGKVAMLLNTYPHKPPRKIRITILCNDQTDCSFDLWPDI